ncbi:2838_t:CDS:2, partial [Dentiscutata erythropus]
MQSFKKTLESNIYKEKSLIKEQEACLKKLKRYAEAQARLEAKKTRLLQEGVVALASVAQTDIKPHVNEHYCLASVKAAWVF